MTREELIIEFYFEGKKPKIIYILDYLKGVKDEETFA